MKSWVDIPFIRKAILRNDSIRTQVLRDSYKGQSKPKGFEGKTFVFTDVDGIRYYMFDSMNDMPLMRREAIDIIVDEMQNRMTYKEKALFVDTGLSCLNSGFSRDEKLSKITWLFEEFKNREELLFNPDCMFRMVSAIYIREDQDATIWDEELEDEKIKVFKKACSHEGGLQDFFYSATLSDFFPFLDGMEKVFETYSKNTTSLVNRQNLLLKDLRKGFTTK